MFFYETGDRQLYRNISNPQDITSNLFDLLVKCIKVKLTGKPPTQPSSTLQFVDWLRLRLLVLALALAR